MIAWACLLLATCAVAALLMGVINLSERRGAFVSAVTHELRTPLTTFRMYAEMLADGMLSDPVQRQKYLQTLRVEADRLWHLVENVLAYAQLERGNHNGRHEVLTVHQLLVRVQPRLEDRARLSQMKMVIDVGEAVGGQMVRTDPSAAEQILFNLVDNACKYATMADDPRIHIDTRLCETRVDFSVKDHGPGISDKALRQLFRRLASALASRCPNALPARLVVRSAWKNPAAVARALCCGCRWQFSFAAPDASTVRFHPRGLYAWVLLPGRDAKQGRLPSPGLVHPHERDVLRSPRQAYWHT